MNFNGYSKRLEGDAIFFQNDETFLECSVSEITGHREDLSDKVGKYLFQYMPDGNYVEKVFDTLEDAFNFGHNSVGVVSYYAQFDGVQ